MEEVIEYDDIIHHVECLSCSSSDAMSIYHPTDGNSNAYCFSCCKTFSTEELEKAGWEVFKNEGEGEAEVKPKKTKEQKPAISDIEIKEVMASTTAKGNGFRGISDETLKFYGFRTQFGSDGSAFKRFYPVTENYKPAAYKVRVVANKDFTWIGRGGKASDFCGQRHFKDGGKRVLIVGGEEDMAAAQQMLWQYKQSRNQQGYGREPVVSPVTGESCVGTVKAQYEWLDSFDEILLGFDNDDAGKVATEKVCQHLPKEKVKLIKWPAKDPNECLEKGMEKQFISAFFEAKPLVDMGIKSAIDAQEEVLEFLTAPKIPLPPQLHKLQENMRGGIRSTGAIVNIIGDTSIGKSFFTDALQSFWFYNSPLVPTTISLERTAGEMLIDFYSLHLKKNLVWFKDGMDAVNYLDRDDVKDLCNDLVRREDGSPRFYIVDEREGSIDILKKQISQVINQYGSRLIVLDPLTDLLRSLGTEAQEDFMMYQKMMKKEGIVFINVLHTRKPPTDKEGNTRKVTEYDALGSGTFVQSSDINIVLNRDKMAADPLIKNTTEVDMPKCRGGETGKACDLYYDSETRQQYDLEYYLKYEVGQGAQKV